MTNVAIIYKKYTYIASNYIIYLYEL